MFSDGLNRIGRAALPRRLFCFMFVVSLLEGGRPWKPQKILDGTDRFNEAGDEFQENWRRING